MGRSDDELLAALGRSIVEQPIRPSPQELSRLRADFWAARTRLRSTARVRWLRPLPVLVATVLAAGTSATAAAATGVALPGPVRSAAVALGLPVDDGAVARIRTELDIVSQTLSSRDHSHLAGQVADLQNGLASLSEVDRAELEPLAAGVLRRAESVLSGPDRSGSGNGAEGGPGLPTPSGQGAPGVTSPASGDHDDAGTTDGLNREPDGSSTSGGGQDDDGTRSGSTVTSTPSTGSRTDGSDSGGSGSDGTGSTSGSSSTSSGGDGSQINGDATSGSGGGTSGSESGTSDTSGATTMSGGGATATGTPSAIPSDAGGTTPTATSSGSSSDGGNMSGGGSFDGGSSDGGGNDGGTSGTMGG